MEYQDELCTVFHDINPRAKIHLLVVPNKHVATVNDMETADEPAFGRMLKVARDTAQKLGLNAYKLLISVGKEAGQEVFHVHLHVMSVS